MPAIRPLEPPFPPDAAQLLERYPKRPDGSLIALFRALAHSPRILARLPNYLDDESPLPAKLREIAILRTTALWRCEYEWSVHVLAFADAVELSEEQVQATLPGREERELWTSEEQLVFDVATGLSQGGPLPPETRRDLETRHPSFQLELIGLCGAYATVSHLANHCHLALEPGAPSWSVRGPATE